MPYGTRASRANRRGGRAGPRGEPGAPPRRARPLPPAAAPPSFDRTRGQAPHFAQALHLPTLPPCACPSGPGLSWLTSADYLDGAFRAGTRYPGQSREGGNGGELSDGKHDSPRSAMERRHPQRPPARVLDARNGPNKVFKKARSAPCRRRAGITRRVLVPPRCLPVKGRKKRAGAAARALSSRLRTRTGSAWMCTAVWGGRRRRGASKKLRYGHTHG